MRVLIADSQPKVRRALRVRLEQAGQVQVVGEAPDAPVMLSRIVHTEADLVLLDEDLPGLAMVELVPVLRRAFPEVRVIVLSTRPEAGPGALAAGADAFVSKSDPAEALLAAIERCRRLTKNKHLKPAAEAGLPGKAAEETMRDNRQHDRIRIGWVIARIGLLLAVIVLFNFFPRWVGVLVSATDVHSFVPLLAPEFQANMPWLNLWWALALALEVVHLCLRRWQPVTRWADLGLSALAGLILLQVMLQGAILVRPEGAAAVLDQLRALQWEQSGRSLLDLLIRGGLALAIVGIAIDALRKLRLCMAGLQRPLPAQ